MDISAATLQILCQVLYFTTDNSILWEIKDSELLLLLEKQKHLGEYTPLKIKNANVHVMNKYSLNRCIDEFAY